MRTIKIVVGSYEVNCYIIYCSNTKEAIIIDPGDEANRILNEVKKNELKVKYIVLTHGHGDHIGAVKEIIKALNIPLLAHVDEKELLEDRNKNLSYIMPTGPTELIADKLLKDGSIIRFGNVGAKVIHTPGHTKGGICLKMGNLLFTGDTIFRASIGRTDLYGGNYQSLINSIKNRLMHLDDSIMIFPGHGDSSTIAYERLFNSFLN